MIKRIEISLIRDDKKGFYGTITLQIPSSISNQTLSTPGIDRDYILNLTGFYLPFNQTLKDDYEAWKESHLEFYLERQRNINIPGPIEVEFKCDKVQNVNSKYSNLKRSINDWLNTKEFSDREKQLRTELGKEDKIMVIISTEDDSAWRLPWHLWNFFDAYINAWVVLSHSESKNVNSNKNDFLGQKVKVLAIFDDVDKKDKSEWEDWSDMSKINNIDLERLIGRQIPDGKELLTISQKMYEKDWNIVFFAGHSDIDTNNGKSKFYIKYPRVYLTINNLENVLSNAVNQGLQLAIFNSCNGLGLARDLLKLNLPNVIVMREDVPAQVAEKFLKYFLKEFMANKGTPAFLAVREAIGKLQREEFEFPSASFLPVMCFNPTTEPLVISVISCPKFERGDEGQGWLL